MNFADVLIKIFAYTVFGVFLFYNDHFVYSAYVSDFAFGVSRISYSGDAEGIDGEMPKASKVWGAHCPL